jgi:hypothetical protein
MEAEANYISVERKMIYPVKWCNMEEWKKQHSSRKVTASVV